MNMGQIDPSRVHQVVGVEPCDETRFSDATRVVSDILDLLVKAILVEVLTIVVDGFGVRIVRVP